MANVLATASHPIDLANGRTLAPGESAEDIDTDDEHNAALVDSGSLVVVDNKAPKRAEPSSAHPSKDKE